MSVVIYLLLCPDSGEVRYVGKTKAPLHVRLAAHISEAKHLDLGYRGNWLRSLIAAGKKPVIVRDTDIDDGADWAAVERARIAYFRQCGCRLVNGTDGGEGLRDPSDEVRSRMSASARNRARRPEGQKLLSENGKKTGPLNRGKPRPPHVGLRVAESNRLRVVTAETRAKMSATRKGRKYSTEHRAAISAGRLARPKGVEPCPR